MVRKISDAFTPYNKNKLRVLLCHNIAEKDFATFREKLKWLSKKWNFINVKDFEEMMNGNKKIIGNNLLLTFDDGFFSSPIVASHDNIHFMR
jgi:peptidoglycan/xylan/chitin deacetylase (PgdA/CDA1 family)